MIGIKARVLLSKKDFTLDVDLKISDAQILVVYGESGSGKTTLLRCIAGLERADEAFVMVNNTVWQDSKNNFFLPTHLRKIGYVAQKNNLFPHLSVKKNLLFGYKRIKEKERKTSFQQVVEWFKIENLLERNIAKLSGGEAQKISIAMALLTSPDILLLDEPLSALGSNGKKEILNLIKNLKQQMSLPIIYVSHLQEETNYIADKTVLIKTQ
jgi:molybdate transport system ATP-binding protein